MLGWALPGHSVSVDDNEVEELKSVFNEVFAQNSIDKRQKVSYLPYY